MTVETSFKKTNITVLEPKLQPELTSPVKSYSELSSRMWMFIWICVCVSWMKLSPSNRNTEHQKIVPGYRIVFPV